MCSQHVKAEGGFDGEKRSEDAPAVAWPLGKEKEEKRLEGRALLQTDLM